MKSKFKKTVAHLLALTSMFSVCSINSVDAYYSGQKHTWRVYEKVSTTNMASYTSYVVNLGNYTYASTEAGELITNESNFDSYYSSNGAELVTTYSGTPKISGTGYLSVSTWYSPTSTSKLNVGYVYETSNNAVITPIYVLVGDFNQDGTVNADDADDLATCIAHSTLSSCSEKALLAADANNDGVVNVRDCAKISSFSSGSINNF